jgi:hypothetical protein
MTAIRSLTINVGPGNGYLHRGSGQILAKAFAVWQAVAAPPWLRFSFRPDGSGAGFESTKIRFGQRVAPSCGVDGSSAPDQVD